MPDDELHDALDLFLYGSYAGLPLPPVKSGAVVRQDQLDVSSHAPAIVRRRIRTAYRPDGPRRLEMHKAESRDPALRAVLD